MAENERKQGKEFLSERFRSLLGDNELWKKFEELNNTDPQEAMNLVSATLRKRKQEKKKINGE